MTWPAAWARCWARSSTPAPVCAGCWWTARACWRRPTGWLTARGLRDRVELSEGDIFRSLSARADVYLLKNILHDWNDQACATILAAVRATMPAGSRLVVVEYLQARNVPNAVASLSDIQMMTQCDDGRERSAEEIKALLRGAGLRPGKVVQTGGPGLVEAFA